MSCLERPKPDAPPAPAATSPAAAAPPATAGAAAPPTESALAQDGAEPDEFMLRAGMTSASDRRNAERAAVKLCLERFTQMSHHLMQVEERLAKLEATVSDMNDKVYGYIDDQVQTLANQASSGMEELNKRIDQLTAGGGVAGHGGGGGGGGSNVSSAALNEVRESLQKDQSRAMDALERKLETKAARTEQAVLELNQKQAVLSQKSSMLEAWQRTKMTEEDEVALQIDSPSKGDKAAAGDGGDALGASENQGLGSTKQSALEVVEAHDGVALKESIWDAAMFICSPYASVGDSILLVVLLLLNLFVQIIFLGITYLVFTQQLFTPDFRSQLENWRINVGHSVKFYDELTFTSLTQRVCDPDLLAEVSSGTNGLVEQMSAYIGEIYLFSGPALTKVALFVWGLTVINELQNVWDVTRSLRALPRSSTAIQRTGDNSLQLSSLHKSRVIWTSFLLFLRATVAILLWIFGSQFICFYTIDMADILLNAVALEIILNVDEAIFTLVPTRIKSIMHRLEPLPAPSKQHGNKKFSCRDDLRPYFFFGVLLIALLILEFAAIQQVEDSIVATNATLCNGTQDFVYSVDPYYLVYTSKTNPYNYTENQTKGYGHIQAINETIYPDTIPTVQRSSTTGDVVTVPNPMSMSFAYDGIAEVKLRNGYTTEQATAGLEDIASTSCVDSLDMGPHWWIQRFALQAQAIFEDTTTSGTLDAGNGISTCSSLRHLCLQWPLLRAVCPTSCGCDDPSGKLLLADAGNGCPASCMATDGPYRTNLETVGCTEMTTTELRNDQTWSSWANQFASQIDFLFYYMPDQKPCDNCTEMVLSNGCGVVGYWKDAVSTALGVDPSTIDPCLGLFISDWLEVKPLTAYCPVTCGCTDTDKTAEELAAMFCPGTC